MSLGHSSSGLSIQSSCGNSSYGTEVIWRNDKY